MVSCAMVGAFAAPVIAGGIGARPTLVLVGLGCLAVGAVGVLRLRGRAGAAEPVADAEPVLDDVRPLA